MKNFKQQNVSKANFDNKDLNGYVFDRCNVIECSFVNANFNGAVIDRCNFIDCNLENTNIYDAEILNSNINVKEHDPEELGLIEESEKAE